MKNYKKLSTLEEIRAISFFSTSLYEMETAEEVLWDITKNVIDQLNFVDCVIYIYDSTQQKLTQCAAYGIKNPNEHQIHNQIHLNLGEGIVGSVAVSKKAEIIPDTSQDSRYLQDDSLRLSEICVPIIVNNSLYGVIDSEHPEKGFYSEKHLYLLNIVAALCSQRIKEIQAKQSKPFAKAHQYFKKLEELMKSKKLYRNPYLSLSSVADAMGISACYLSSMMNTILNKSFIDFINEYRITDVKRNLNSAEFAHYTTVSVGLEAGFNSKSAFYSAFKKHTGLTPTEYQNRFAYVS